MGSQEAPGRIRFLLPRCLLACGPITAALGSLRATLCGPPLRVRSDPRCCLLKRIKAAPFRAQRGWSTIPALKMLNHPANPFLPLKVDPHCQRTDAFEPGCWRRLLRVPWTARRYNQSILKEISPEYSLEGLMLKLKLQYFGHLMRRTGSLEKTLILGKT